MRSTSHRFQMTGVELLALLLLAAVGVCANAAEEKAKRIVDFARDIQPILAKRCWECHGEQDHEGGLRLDVRKLVMQGGDSGRAIVSGKSVDSLLVGRIVSTDEDERMPLGEEPLPQAEIDLLRRWVEQGAEWPDAFAGEGLGGERRLAIESRGLQAEKKPCRPPQQMDVTSVTGICQKGGLYRDYFPFPAQFLDDSPFGYSGYRKGVEVALRGSYTPSLPRVTVPVLG